MVTADAEIALEGITVELSKINDVVINGFMCMCVYAMLVCEHVYIYPWNWIKREIERKSVRWSVKPGDDGCWRVQWTARLFQMNNQWCDTNDAIIAYDDCIDVYATCEHLFIEIDINTFGQGHRHLAPTRSVIRNESSADIISALQHCGMRSGEFKRCYYITIMTVMMITMIVRWWNEWIQQAREYMFFERAFWEALLFHRHD